MEEAKNSYPELFPETYNHVAWGYVERNGKMLVGKRYKKDDSLRTGQLIIPGGHVENETEIDAAVREVFEETGIYSTVRDNNYIRLDNESSVIKIRKNIIAFYNNGLWTIHYNDSGKTYKGSVYDLVPKNNEQEPVENCESDVKEPSYITFDEAKSRRKEFTPACQLLLELLLDKQFVKMFDIVIKD